MTRRDVLVRAGASSITNERGAVAVLVAVAAVALLGLLALSIDLAYLFKARNDAQRAADAAALAGASAFLDYSPFAAVPAARRRAREYARRNTFLNGPIDSSEIYIGVFPESAKVGVYVYRDSVPTWFAHLLGQRFRAIGAFAAAVAANAGAAKCLKPFAVPDLWHDGNGDLNFNRIPDEGEVWHYGDDPLDLYKPYTGPGGEADETGYGSAWRDVTTPEFGDYGRQIDIKLTDPNDVSQAASGIFMPWRLPADSTMEPCEGHDLVTGESGAAVYRQNICSCNTSSIQLGVDYYIETGNMVGPTFQGITQVIDQDANAYWDQSTNTVVNSAWSDWTDSPRIVKIGLIAPDQITGPGMQTIQFNNFALFFIEAFPDRSEAVTGRFLYYVTGQDDPGAAPGSLVKVIRLVK